MSSTEVSFDEAIQRICSGSVDAVGPFVETYGPHLQRVVRSRLNRSLRAKFDSLDFVQMVWASFFSDVEKLQQFTDPDKLYAYLVTMAKNKVVDESRRRLKYQKYNVGRETALEIDKPLPGSTRQDTPSQWLMAREHFDEVLGAQSPRDQSIFSLRMQGFTFDQIAEKLAISERTARQVWSDIQRELRSKPNDSEEPGR